MQNSELHVSKKSGDTHFQEDCESVSQDVFLKHTNTLTLTTTKPTLQLSNHLQPTHHLGKQTSSKSGNSS